MAKIKSIKASQVLDSRGLPTIETTVELSDGAIGISSVPSGESRGTYEAFDLRDSDNMGVFSAIENVNSVIGPKVSGIEAHEQKRIDRIMIELDGTQNKSRLGANAVLSVSQAVLKAAARSSLLPLSLYIREFLSHDAISKSIPVPLFNVLEGGKHAGNLLNFQEFLIVPPSSSEYSESLKLGISVYQSVKHVLSEKNILLANALEGGFVADLAANADALNLLKTAIERSNHAFSVDVFLGIDAAANSFKNGKVYILKDRSAPYSQDDLVEYYAGINSEFSLMYIEDPFAEDDWEGWKKAFSEFSGKTLIVGDDLTTTNPYRLQLALDNNVINGMIIKPNQIGTISETLAVIEIARYKNLKIIVSHRGGETMDDFIADFAVGVGADFVKFGAPARERVIKYNRLLKIQQELAKI